LWDHKLLQSSRRSYEGYAHPQGEFIHTSVGQGVVLPLPSLTASLWCEVCYSLQSSTHYHTPFFFLAVFSL
jgi:hypothetical protein